MFDVGISEMMVIAVVALVVLGPEKLPKVARTAGHLMGRARRYVDQVKQDINREMEMSELKKLQSEVQHAAQTFQSSMNDVSRSVESEAKSFESSVSSSVAELQSPPEATSPGSLGDALGDHYDANYHAPPAATPAERIDPR
jgi:sec-independent protein translocase protein TatB